MIPEQDVSDVFVDTEEVSIDSEKLMEIDVPTETPVWLLVGEVDETVGAVVSTTKVFTFNEILVFPVESVTVIVQSEYVPSFKELKLIVLSPETAVVVVLVQLPP